MLSKVRSFFGSKSARNGVWIILERLVSVGIATVVMIFSARYLGAENYGVLTYGLSFVALFSSVMKLGLDSVMVNELIDHRHKEGSFLGTSIVLRLISSLLSIVSIGLILSVINAGEELIIAVAVIQAIILIFQAFNILDFWFQSRLRSKYVSIAKIIASLLGAAYSTYLLVTGSDVVWFAFSTVLGGGVLAAALVVFYTRQSDARLTFSLVDARYLLGKSHHFITAGIISTIYIQIDRVMIGNMIGQEQLGLYSAAMTLCTAWIFLPDAIITSMRPGIVSRRATSYSQYLKKLKRLYFIIFWLSVVVSAVVAVSAPLLVKLLFGPEFTGSTLVVQIAVWYVPLSILGTARNIWMVTEGKSRYVKYILLWGVLVNIIGNLILIPLYGISGAALATVLTEIITGFVAPLIYKHTRSHVQILIGALFGRS